MTAFRFQAYAPSGQTMTGVIEAKSLPDALSLLRQRGVSPYLAEPLGVGRRVKPANGFFFRGGLGLEWRARTIRKLATLLAAGITLDRALHIMVSQSARTAEKRVLSQVLNMVVGGAALSVALGDAAGLVKADEVGLLKAGESGGSLVFVLEELADLIERRQQMRGKLASALIYPAFLLALAPISLLIIATELVPNIAPLFETSGAPMPFALRAMIWATDQLENNAFAWALVLLAILGAAAAMLANSSMRGSIRRIIDRLPVVRTIARRAEAARICRTLGTLLRSGAPLQNALSAVIGVSSRPFTQAALHKARDLVSGGEKLAAALKGLPSLDANALQMISVGEETNRLETMLLYVSDSEEKALATYVDRLMVLLTPLLTILMGIFVGGIVMSIMKAILSVNDLAMR